MSASPAPPPLRPWVVTARSADVNVRRETFYSDAATPEDAERDAREQLRNKPDTAPVDDYTLTVQGRRGAPGQPVDRSMLKRRDK
jgi:hypothetical protein